MCCFPRSTLVCTLNQHILYLANVSSTPNCKHEYQISDKSETDFNFIIYSETYNILYFHHICIHIVHNINFEYNLYILKTCYNAEEML